jgi:hypothetical protein
MSDERSRDGNGAVVAIVVVLGIVVFLGLMIVFLGGFVFWSRSSPVMVAPPAAVATTVAPAPQQVPDDDLSAASTGEVKSPQTDSLPADSLNVEVDDADQILIGGKATSLADLQVVFKDIKNGNSPFTKINIKFAGSSDSKTKEVALALKEACILYTVDPAGKTPAELEAPQ